MSARDDALYRASVAAAHHVEVVELAIEESNRVQMADTLLDAGVSLDKAILAAHEAGATLFQIWLATRHLPVGYILELTSGTLGS